MFDEYDDDFSYEPEYTEKQVNKELKELNEKRRTIRYKKGICSSKILGAMAIMTGITTLCGIIGGTIIGHSPLKKDDVIRKAHIKTLFNSDRETKVSKQYAPFDSEKSLIRYYSDGVQTEDEYILCESTYDVTGLTYKDVDGFIKIKGIDEKPFGEPISEKIVSRDAPLDGPQYAGVIYETDENDRIVTLQTDSEDKVDKIGFLLTPTIVGAAYATFIALATDNDKVAELKKLSEEGRSVKREIDFFEEKKKSLKKEKKLVKKI